jgi:ABC-2 type transport system permease protein
VEKLNLRRVRAISRKEFIQILRDPRSLGLAIIIPVVLLVLFGFALTLDVDNVPLAIWNQDGSKTSRDFILNFKNSRYFKIIGYYNNYRDLQSLLDHSTAMMVMVIPKDFSRDLDSAQAAPVQLLVDGSDSNTATIAMGYVRSVVAGYNIRLITSSLDKQGLNLVTPAQFRPRIWFNPNLLSKYFIIPGLIAIIIMIISALLTSLTVAREWERGTMEQLISTPVEPVELIFGKFIPYFVIGFFDLILAVVMSLYLFMVPFCGSMLLLFVSSSIFLVAALMTGIMISVTSKSQLMASQIAILSTFIPTFLLSGFMYPIYNMPKAIQLVTYLIPARYYITIIRGIYLKGNGIAVLWPQVLVLCVFACVVVIIAVRKFKKKVA